MKYASYEVTYYRKRSDGRVEPAGREKKVLNYGEALELSHTAIVQVLNGKSPTGIYIVDGKCSFYGDRGELLS